MRSLITDAMVTNSWQEDDQNFHIGSYMYSAGGKERWTTLKTMPTAVSVCPEYNFGLSLKTANDEDDNVLMAVKMKL